MANRRHIGTDVGKVRRMELAKEPPEVSFDTVASSSGFETIERARR
jgi:hypothetical protein